MSITQNEKIRQVTEQTLVVGVDIASEVQWACAFDWRGIELGKVTSFENNAEGFDGFKAWMEALCGKEQKTSIIIGAEPTGHYWAGRVSEREGSEPSIGQSLSRQAQQGAG